MAIRFVFSMAIRFVFWVPTGEFFTDHQVDCDLEMVWFKTEGPGNHVFGIGWSLSLEVSPRM